MLLWFGYWVVDWSSARYGVILSMVAGGGLLLGAVGEARALTTQSWLRTGCQLLLGRLSPPLGEGQCPRCGYLLYGLTENRCPECGREFTFQEVGLNPEGWPTSAEGSDAKTRTQPITRATAFDAGEHVETRRRARPWRRLTVLGGALLAASFFLPAITVCNADVIPAEELVDAVTSVELRNLHVSCEGLLQSSVGTCACLSAYLAGFLLAAAAVARICRWRKLNQVLGKAMLVVLAGTALILLSAFGCSFVKEGPPEWDTWPAVLVVFIFPLVAMIYLLRAIRTQHLALGGALIASLWMLCWFGLWVAREFSDIRYGLWLSLAGTGLLLVVTVGEARALTGQTWRRSFWRLLTTQLAGSLETRGHCPNCDYLLYGLTEKRCPECGRGFTVEEVGLSAEELASAVLGSSAPPI